MCPFIDSQLFSKKAERKILTLILSENEDILASIKEGMRQHNLRECKVEGMGGKIKQGQINFTERSQYKVMNLQDSEVMLASGNFKRSFDDLWGGMHVSLSGKKPVTGTLVKGTASEGLEIKLSFVEAKE